MSAADFVLYEEEFRHLEDALRRLRQEANGKAVFLIGEREFSVLFHEGQQDHIHISIVAKRAILVVIFDDRSSLGLVRLRVRRANGDLEKIFEVMVQKGAKDA